MNEKEAIKLLKKYSKDKDSFEKVLEHGKCVQKIALRIGKKIQERGNEINLEFIRIGSLLHDIGRFNHPPWSDTVIQHGVEGEAILKKEKLNEYAHICSSHLGGVGIRKKDIEEQQLPLPKKDYLPQTIEEKIVAYADVITRHNEEIPIEKAIDRFRKEIGEALANRIKARHEELQSLQ